ncbi:glutathione binding-like protein [Limibaculum sp. FT325]|uniref:glutathione binding-like protein n=1 Tax=Thermohalobaculum sediminis TaxID=2939436 RepID=UPI0020BE5150|nr:glutathione binding-like protein [Limibaculum sediminis]MCL5776123.1 glutathione binding-like protein [Limibaculum sediminis]
MKLYYSPGTCSQSVHIALHEAGVEHDIVRVDLAARTTEDGGDYARINPLGYVPALELDGGEVLLEAPAILQFVADLRPEAGLAPANGTFERVRLQEQLNFTASELHKSFGPFFAPVKPEGALRAQALAKLGKRFDALEARLSDGRAHVMGESFTVADAYTFVVASWAGLIGFDLAQHPRVRDYVARVARRPHVREVLAREGLAA